MAPIVLPTMAEREIQQFRTAYMPAGKSSVFLTLRDNHGANYRNVAGRGSAGRLDGEALEYSFQPTDKSRICDA